ncbi:MAG: bifunctional 5,6,7,8-tetrahydromethanopterin hydro-lyase/3-hexulose-6-phosphate synthase [Candidatus Helarchaeota archaeon]|nr:bifunctional 5,6,7,8-tetrahydromethanopterin hydro-lyase/3-hexulose-6-phosphate synthase [Candidatus Helarchaeota archaeon]
MYAIGEALLGREPELAHVDLIIGEKKGNVGIAFANALSHLSKGHTPLLAVIRPNLPCKPWTVIIPKVTIEGFSQITKIFGSAQYAVAKAVADAVEEGLIPKGKIEEWVIIVSVFVHPQAKNDRKIYTYNYSATKLAIRRALSNYPPYDKILYDKDRAKHPVLGFRVPRLWRPPYLQIALDVPSKERTLKIIKMLPKSDRIILEVGTPLLKHYGTQLIGELRESVKDAFIIADLKTLDVGKVEVDLAFEETADAVVAAGLASIQTLDKFVYEARRLGIYSFIDMMDLESPLEKLKKLKDLPDLVIMHRAIDTEADQKPRWDLIKEIKELGVKLVAVAGGIRPMTTVDALKSGADIIIVGRYITQSKDVERSTREFLKIFEEKKYWSDIDLFRVHEE